MPHDIITTGELQQDELVALLEPAEQDRYRHLVLVAHARGLDLGLGVSRLAGAGIRFWLSNPYVHNALELGGEWGTDLDNVEEYLHQ